MHGRSQSNSSRSAQWIYRVTASRRIIPDGHSDRKHNLVDENRTYHTLKVLARSAIELANSWKVGRPEVGSKAFPFGTKPSAECKMIWVNMESTSNCASRSVVITKRLFVGGHS